MGLFKNITNAHNARMKKYTTFIHRMKKKEEKRSIKNVLKFCWVVLYGVTSLVVVTFLMIAYIVLCSPYFLIKAFSKSKEQ